jgi:two-component system cell cycle sensor histidine kinase/response regulator CckA
MSTILVVDDEAIIVRLAATVLRMRGHHVLAADSLTDALECVASHDGEIPLLLVDHSVTQLAGPDLVQALRGLKPRMKVLRFSGFLESYLKERGEMRHDSFFLQKPFTAKQLVEKVNEILLLAS